MQEQQIITADEVLVRLKQLQADVFMLWQHTLSAGDSTEAERSAGASRALQTATRLLSGDRSMSGQ